MQGKYTKRNHFRFSNLHKEFHSIKQGDHNLSIYFTDLKIIWDELEYLCLTPSRTCFMKCSCYLSSSIKKFKHLEYITCFLKDLNENYNNIRIQILFMGRLPSFTKTYSMVIQQEPSPHTPSIDSTILDTCS